MHTITESNIFLRAQTILPDGSQIGTDEFGIGWSVMRSGGKRRLEKIMRAKGWSFVRLAAATMRGGVGKSAQAAITSALMLAFRRVGADSNALEVGRIEVTKYPWFFLARLTVNPYSMRKQESSPLSMPVVGRRMAAPQPSSIRKPPSIDPLFGCPMPILKALLTSSGSSLASAN
jgi:hypothetical protein